MLSHSLCVSIRDALCACAGLAGRGKPLRLPWGGVRAHRPTEVYRQTAHRGWPPGRPETRLAPYLMQKTMSLRGRAAPVAIRTSRLRSCLRRLPFFLRRKKGRKERRQNQWFWNPFRGQDTARSGTLQPRELSTAKFAPCFRIVSASPSATRSALVLAWRDGGNLCVCRGAA